MSFSQFKQRPSSFYPENRREQNYPVKPVGYPYSLEEMQYQMYCFYEQNRYFQQQFMQQQYNQMLEQQLLLKNNSNQIKVQEPTNHFEKNQEHHQIEDANKCIQQTLSVSKGIFKRTSNKIRKSKPQKNETKNIPKNYGKAIVSFIENNKEVVKKVLSKFSSMTYISFVNLLRLKKNKINSIADLRTFWLEGQEKDFAKVIRILSNVFLRHFSLDNFSGHVKYRARLIQALRNPQCFTSIKQY